MTLRNIGPSTATTIAAALVAAGLASGAATGQSPAAHPTVALPKHECGAKPEHPGRDASETKQRQWRKDANAYLECFKNYAMEQRALAQQYQEAANAVIDEYNATVKEMQAAAEAAAPSN